MRLKKIFASCVLIPLTFEGIKACLSFNNRVSRKDYIRLGKARKLPRDASKDLTTRDIAVPKRYVDIGAVEMQDFGRSKGGKGILFPHSPDVAVGSSSQEIDGTRDRAEIHIDIEDEDDLEANRTPPVSLIKILESQFKPDSKLLAKFKIVYYPDNFPLWLGLKGSQQKNKFFHLGDDFGLFELLKKYQDTDPTLDLFETELTTSIEEVFRKAAALEGNTANDLAFFADFFKVLAKISALDVHPDKRSTLAYGIGHNILNLRMRHIRFPNITEINQLYIYFTMLLNDLYHPDRGYAQFMLSK